MFCSIVNWFKSRFVAKCGGRQPPRASLMPVFDAHLNVREIAASPPGNGIRPETRSDANLTILDDAVDYPSIHTQINRKTKSAIKFQIDRIASELQDRMDRHAELLDRRIKSLSHRVHNEVAEGIKAQTRGTQLVVAKRLDSVPSLVTSAIEKRLDDHAATLRQEMSAACSDISQRAVQRPLVDSLIALFDRCRSERDFLNTSFLHDAGLALNVNARQAQERSDGVLNSVCDEILLVLRGLGVEMIHAGIEKFDPRSQKVVGVQPTKRADLDGHVHQISRAGFLWHRAMLRPVEVTVFKYEEKSHGN